MTHVSHEVMLGNGSREKDVLAQEEKKRIAQMLTRELAVGSLSVLGSASLGRRDSAHDVFFVSGACRADQPLAIKRFRRSESAVAERDAMLRVAGMGIRTLELAGDGVYDVGEFGSALVTWRMPNLVTMDRVDWKNTVMGMPNYEGVARTLQGMAWYMGSVHRAGVVHGDWQPKNFGQVPSGDRIFFDAENARFRDDEGAFPFGGLCRDDVEMLTGTLVTMGYLGSVQESTFRDEMARNVLDPYWEANPSETVLEQWDDTMERLVALRNAAGPTYNPRQYATYA